MIRNEYNSLTIFPFLLFSFDFYYSLYIIFVQIMDLWISFDWKRIVYFSNTFKLYDII